MTRSRSKLASGENMLGATDTEDRSVLNVRDGFLSTGATTQVSAEVEFRKRSIEELSLEKLNNLIIRLINLLEVELDSLDSSKLKNALSTKKAITDLLSKLVSVVVQLNKLDKEKSFKNVAITSQDDMKIIEFFLDKYKEQN